jgi:hypothetical protein
MKDLIKSKKFRTMMLGILSIIAIKIAGLKGIVLDPATATSISEMVFGLASAYLLAQGAADFGKEGKLKAVLSGAMEVARNVSADAPAPEPEAAPAASPEPEKAEEAAPDSE